jgi:hypothetical protein
MEMEASTVSVFIEPDRIVTTFIISACADRSVPSVPVKQKQCPIAQCAEPSTFSTKNHSASNHTLFRAVGIATQEAEDNSSGATIPNS